MYFPEIDRPRNHQISNMIELRVSFESIVMEVTHWIVFKQDATMRCCLRRRNYSLLICYAITGSTESILKARFSPCARKESHQFIYQAQLLSLL